MQNRELDKELGVKTVFHLRTYASAIGVCDRRRVETRGHVELCCLWVCSEVVEIVEAVGAVRAVKVGRIVEMVECTVIQYSCYIQVERQRKSVHEMLQIKRISDSKTTNENTLLFLSTIPPPSNPITPAPSPCLSPSSGCASRL